MHRLDIEVEREIEIAVRAFENAAVMHETGAIGEDIDAAYGFRQGFDRCGRADIEGRVAAIKAGQLVDMKIGCADRRAFSEIGFAIARPIPCPAAVTSAVLPFKRLPIFPPSVFS